MENKSLWKIYKERYLNRKTSFTDIEKFLIDDYGIELLHISIETPVEPYHRWKAELRRKTKGLSNIVYINCYEDHEVLRPLICGVTKTGDKRTIDFNFNKDENTGKMSDEISGRKFLKENDINYHTKSIYLFGCDTENDARLMERAIQHEFNLFGS
ncbi:hypothetical protein MX634_16265 [Carnobacterium maltaromaticum]|uniref:hypothetical protein n=1 Tax=Carnobacterium maltaromaticum TaxID=2751 RepID=UPI00288D878B|nr:hypothetical protein [Carnobacterium maltaromaticum]MDT1946491.1 hypothetical protein [Carnobacterium maltaromaticum]MDT2000858.1 hypothetical protein [Carnobacterium maltaromaticum]